MRVLSHIFAYRFLLSLLALLLCRMFPCVRAPPDIPTRPPAPPPQVAWASRKPVAFARYTLYSRHVHPNDTHVQVRTAPAAYACTALLYG